ncbi:MAG: ornithine carbamoyltransferase [Candidatus Omnitrophica bacterium]|nr:ornithine carbamoyltransferase [Candidatus Omnitrophota bacterium]MBD3269307.1 ornithine carbamoyltransferase [Candidatus Omnitrophota bacterium]
MGHFISLKYFSPAEIKELVALAGEIKKRPSGFSKSLKDKSIGLLFEKPSLRTKTAFYLGALQLGGQPLYYSSEEVKLGKREEIKDVARTFSCYLDAVVIRTFSQKVLAEFAQFSSKPVINGLSDFLHPSQVLADILTIQEVKGDITKLKVVYSGDTNNVCNSLIYIFAKLGGDLRIAVPRKYMPARSLVKEADEFCKKSCASIKIYNSLDKAVKGADVIYTDVWTSMGKEKERASRKKDFKKFQINDKILKLAKSNCIVMHCLPAHRGEEITDSVIEGKNAKVFSQAENRLYAAKAILLSMVAQKPKKGGKK